ncbi:uncharacterized protein [Drosophila bipectinata]|uniref:uncharacterized protein n=1 Tax=Drosophila bipectinata TaxID=42026 RepID=UPI001C890304|nr:uncharacterized protein LOC108130442 [Drosophila bipectinata]
MEDPRNRELKKLINLYCGLQQATKFQMQRIFIEEVRFEKSVARGESNHTKLERLEKMKEFHDLFKESLRQQNKLTVTIQQFLDFNSELKDTKYYQEASLLLERQKAEDLRNRKLLCQQMEKGNAALDDALEAPDHSSKELDIVTTPPADREPGASEVADN